MTFIKDLEFGREYEKKLETLIEYDEIEFAPKCRFTDYDVKIKYNDKITLFEVKVDKMTSNTNNLFIEFECSGNKSGIETTKSNYYAYFEVGENDVLYMIPTRKLKKMIKHHKYSSIKNCYNAKGYIFNKQLFENYIF